MRQFGPSVSLVAGLVLALLAAEASAQLPAVRPPTRSVVNACEEGHWIQEVLGDGQIVRLEDGSMWKVDEIDTITTGLWLPVSNVILCSGRMINVDDGESVSVTPVLATTRSHIIQATANDKTFIINGEVFKAKTYCFNVNRGDKVLFTSGSASGACVSAEFIVTRTGKSCSVWCE